MDGIVVLNDIMAREYVFDRTYIKGLKKYRNLSKTNKVTQILFLKSKTPALQDIRKNILWNYKAIYSSLPTTFTNMALQYI